jgi:hypothetical protein
MHHRRIEAAAPPGTTLVELTGPNVGATLLGVAVLTVGVPLVIARLLIYGVGRSLAKVATFATIAGEAIIEAAHTR